MTSTNTRRGLTALLRAGRVVSVRFLRSDDRWVVYGMVLGLVLVYALSLP